MQYRKVGVGMGSKTAAIVLAAGSGKRMNSNTKKQYLLLNDKPIIYYALKAFQESFVDTVVLVAAPGEVSYCEKEIVNRYGFDKVKHIVEGGKERYHSVMAGLSCLENIDYIFIHDGARPMITQEILERTLLCVKETDACAAGMPAKDTIKIADEKGNIAQTPNRNKVWMIQTPQVFSFQLISQAYKTLLHKEEELLKKGINITDDAMVVEELTGHSVRLVQGSYENIKITTPEDLKIAECFLEQ